MTSSYLEGMRRPTLAIGLVAVLGSVLGACTSTGEKREANLYQDRTTCADFGARLGSREYTDCMLTQQSRRDQEKLNALERQRISTQLGKDSLEMSRKVQCDLDAKKDREAGRRPQRCD